MSRTAAEPKLSSKPSPKSAPKLTARQHEVLRCLIGTCSHNRDIARVLGISQHTVAAHLKAIYQAYKVSSRLDLLRRVSKDGAA